MRKCLFSSSLQCATPHLNIEFIVHTPSDRTKPLLGRHTLFLSLFIYFFRTTARDDEYYTC